MPGSFSFLYVTIASSAWQSGGLHKCCTQLVAVGIDRGTIYPEEMSRDLSSSTGSTGQFIPGSSRRSMEGFVERREMLRSCGSCLAARSS